MRRRYVLMGLAAIATLSLALPAAGAPSPATLAKRALGLAKKANKRAKTADTSANRALAQIRDGVPRALSADSASVAGSAGTAGSANSASRAGDAEKLDGKDSSQFAGSSHDHDGRYYTKAEVDAAVAAARDDAWAYVIGSGAFHASSGSNISVTRPATGEYCVVVPKRSSHKAAQATLADPGGSKIVSVGTGHGSACNPLNTTTHDAVPVYVRTTTGTAVDGNFTIVIPAP